MFVGISCDIADKGFIMPDASIAYKGASAPVKDALIDSSSVQRCYTAFHDDDASHNSNQSIFLIALDLSHGPGMPFILMLTLLRLAET